MTWSKVIAATVLVLFSIAARTSAEQNHDAIRPMRASVTFDANSKSQHSSAYLYSLAGTKLYVLWLFPEIDVNQHAVGVELIMSKPTDKNPDLNLLNPHNWHGLQPFSFAAADLVQGPKRSGYGVVRIVPLQARGIKVEIDLVNSNVQPLSDGGYELTKLSLNIAVDNLGASGIRPVDSMTPE